MQIIIPHTSFGERLWSWLMIAFCSVKTTRFWIRICFACIFSLAIASCKQEKDKQVTDVFFKVLDYKRTGIDFANKLTATPSFNMFKYMYFYNGAGVGAGDFNNDGKIDLFFSSNQHRNRLFLNNGNLSFRDVTEQANIPADSGWSTGVSLVDINNDGRLDIYVCRVGNYESLKSSNQLLINKGVNAEGIPVFTDSAREYGLNFSGFSTQAAFFDYDLDGDLDMYLMNHSLRFNGTFQERKSYLNTYDSLAGDRFYRNDNNRFVDITRTVGINSSIIGYGLGIAVSDINLDGYPDIYIGNDFHENDYLYINQRNGRFREELTERTMHTSQFSMGVDVADIDNDAWPEIVSVDMLPYDPYILKRSLGEDAYEIFNFKIRHGYNHQYARNNLQLNRGKAVFSEIGLYAGVYATDWSWAPLWMDFDNDGLKDLFISNGIPKRLNDIDYVNFVSNEELQQKIRSNALQNQDMTLIDKFPEIKLPNKFYHNKGELQFEDVGKRIGNDVPTFSNGSVYADLDNDGDLDIVVNNVDDPVLIYENQHNNKVKTDSAYFDVVLKGPMQNPFAIGARILVFAGDKISTYEKFPVRGFQSSMEIPIHIGMGSSRPDSILLIWPDNSYQQLDIKPGQSVLATYSKGLPFFDFDKLTTRTDKSAMPLMDITDQTGLLYKHIENPFIEFDREPLIPHMISREGPALATGDLNKDGLDDLFIGSSKGNKPAVFVQQSNGRFEKTAQPALDKDSMYEETAAEWADLNNDGAIDLLLASGGNEYFGKDEHLQPRIFLNDGKANLIKKENAFNGIYLTASCIVSYDFTGDGYLDLFVGGRAVPWEYGQIPSSYLLENDKLGGFKDVTSKYAGQLSTIGLVKNAYWVDIDKNGFRDLIVCLEWGGIEAFMYNGKSFSKKTITDRKGWWNFLLPTDIDADGDMDFIAGNLGGNSRLKATKEEPVRLYYYDFDGNEKKEQVLTYYLQNKEIPFANKEELQKQLPGLKKQFLYAEDFAKAGLNDLFGSEKLSRSRVLSADYFSNAILLNDGNLNFTMQELPWQCQLSTYRCAMPVNANNDKLPDILLFGNYYENNIQMGRYDADYGSLLINKGGGKFEYRYLGDPALRGEIRNLRMLTVNNEQILVLAKNNDSLRVFRMRGN